MMQRKKRLAGGERNREGEDRKLKFAQDNEEGMLATGTAFATGSSSRGDEKGK